MRRTRNKSGSSRQVLTALDRFKTRGRLQILRRARSTRNIPRLRHRAQRRGPLRLRYETPRSGGRRTVKAQKRIRKRSWMARTGRCVLGLLHTLLNHPATIGIAKVMIHRSRGASCVLRCSFFASFVRSSLSLSLSLSHTLHLLSLSLSLSLFFA